MDKLNGIMEKELVSVLVPAFHSGNTIVETLQSIYHQTYQNLELIVTDDGSADESIELIQDWIEANRARFQHAVLLTSEENTGISKNVNRGAAACKGDWIKIIAADDLLLPNCIEEYIRLVRADEGRIKIYQSNEEVINEKGEITGCMENERLRMKKLAAMETVKEQYRYFLFNDIKVSPTLFFSRKVFHEVGGCDEEIRNIDDYPLKLRFLQKGYRMGHLDSTTVQYRIHNSISHSQKEVCPLNHVRQRRILKKRCCYPYIPKTEISYWVSEYLERFQENMIIFVFRNKPGLGVKCFMKAMSYLIPRQWERRLVERKAGK